MTLKNTSSNPSPSKIGRVLVLKFCIPLYILSFIVLYISFILNSLFLPDNLIGVLIELPAIILALLWMLLINVPSLFGTPFLLFILALLLLLILVTLGQFAGTAIIIKSKNVYVVGILTIFFAFEVIFISSYYLSVLYKSFNEHYSSGLISSIMFMYERWFIKISIFGAILALIIGPFLGKKIQTLGQKAGLTST